MLKMRSEMLKIRKKPKQSSLGNFLNPKDFRDVGKFFVSREVENPGKKETLVVGFSTIKRNRNLLQKKSSAMESTAQLYFMVPALCSQTALCKE